MGHSAINLISPSSGMPPTSLPQQVMHPSQQPGHPFNGAMPPPHPLMHPSFLHAMHQFHSNPYTGYPFSYPYPYGPMSQPHAIPPQQSSITTRPEIKAAVESSTTMLSSQHSSSTSSLTARRELRELDGNGEERHQTHETTLTQRQSTSHHSAVHASTDNQGFGGTSQSITISHTTSTSSSQSLQHKVNQKTVRISSPHAPSSQVCFSRLIRKLSTKFPLLITVIGRSQFEPFEFDFESPTHSSSHASSRETLAWKSAVGNAFPVAF